MHRQIFGSAAADKANQTLLSLLNPFPSKMKSLTNTRGKQEHSCSMKEDNLGAEGTQSIVSVARSQSHGTQTEPGWW